MRETWCPSPPSLCALSSCGAWARGGELQGGESVTGECGDWWSW